MNYYHKFLPNLATVLHPMNQLLEQSNKRTWTTDCEEAFVKVKKLITSDMVFTHLTQDDP